jgi:HSP20 family protein
MNTLIPLNEIRRMEDLFSGLFNPTQPSANLTIPVDIIEAEGLVTIRAAVPGISAEGLEITVENHILTIKGENPASPAPENAKIYRSENVYGEFSRSLRLGKNLNLEAIDAIHKNGFVTITIPIIEPVKPPTVRIPIKTEN